MVQNTLEIKEKILFILKKRGPSLPVHVAGETELSILFASAFLSELLSEKKIKISNMRVGNSPIYFISGQESLLERFSQYLKSKEKDAFMLLKQKKILKDEEQDPAIRVALRAIKDFAIPFRKNEEIFWRYFLVPESEFNLPKTLPLLSHKIPSQQKTSDSTTDKKINETDESKVSEPKQELGIFDKKPDKTKPKTKEKIKSKKISQKKNEKFFNKIKEYLSQKSIKILDIESFNKNDLVLKVKKNEKEKLLIAYNKKRVTESDLIKAYKKASELGLKYIILSFGEPLKKVTDMIEAIKNLSEIEKIE